LIQNIVRTLSITTTVYFKTDLTINKRVNLINKRETINILMIVDSTFRYLCKKKQQRTSDDFRIINEDGCFLMALMKLRFFKLNDY